ncbi:putative 2-dehydropantoate 2-reductase [Marinobacter nanhaiticus D15-8W]|nr:2-dehydropantoate 2-reductase [Marinobacter nanhaiticus]BES71837.1 putative 2-dehydropantoate 2-reductase [Marinobacter nanhaiticus D15-8W]
MTQAIKPRILIIGAGAMGRLWAGYLQPCSELFFATRTAQAPRIDFVFCDSHGDRHRIDIPVCRNHDLAPDLILLTTKAPDAEAALVSAEQLLHRRRPVILFQNGMGSQQAIAARFSSVPILAASTTEGAYIDAAGELIHAGRGQTWVGALNECAHSHVATAAEQLGRSGLEVSVDKDVEDRLWQKLAINAGINPFTALLDCSNGEILGHDYFEERIGAVCHEVSQLMHAVGRTAHPEELEARVRDVARRTAANSSSMRQDIRSGRPTEVDMMNGFIARESESLGLPAPVNRALTEAVKALR